ncbi:MAG: hypothetical protein FE78DRAFT_36696 [Acidomyces sp. 'richmondensis']|nr:MAG: hypothetical protein FE78DRAFT_36696 [Acidomyces sp. 'richmondensis']
MLLLRKVGHAFVPRSHKTLTESVTTITLNSTDDSNNLTCHDNSADLTVLGSETVSGSVVGIIRTRTDGRIAGVCERATHLATHTFLNETLMRMTLEGAGCESVAENRNFQIPFKFCMTDFEARFNFSGQGSTAMAWTSAVLPPSVSSKKKTTKKTTSITGPATKSAWPLKQSQRDVTVDCLVSYTIIANVSVGRRQISSTSLEFFYVPVSPTELPVAVHGDLNDYKFIDRQAIKRSLSFKSNPSRAVQIQAEQPVPIIINMLNRTGSTTVNFTISTIGLELDSVPIKCHVNACLVSILFITPMWQEDRAPTLYEGRCSQSSKIHEEISHPQGCLLPITDWKRITPEEHAGKHEQRNVAMMKYRFVVDGEMPCPTFFTPLVSKRYHLITVVSFRHTGGWAVLRLSLPLQIKYNDLSPPHGE